MHHILIILSILWWQEIPYKPKEEFEIKLDYQFKQRPQGDHNSVNLGETRSDYERRTTGSVLPYLVLRISVLKLPEEKMRMRISKNRDDRPVNRKIDLNSVIELTLGFTDDMKDRVTAHEYSVAFLTAEKTMVNQILISVDKDGSFFVNGEKRGKF